MSENQEPKPETPKDTLAELSALAGEARAGGMINIGEGLKLDVAGIKSAFFTNHYCQTLVRAFTAARNILRVEYRPENPTPAPDRPHCFACAIDRQFEGLIEGCALALALVSVEGKAKADEMKRVLHAFTKLVEEAIAVAEQINATGGPAAHMPKPQA